MALFSTPQTFLEAAMTGDIQELAHCLDDKNYDVNYKNLRGENALLLAIECRQADAVKFLLKYTPDLEHTDRAGRTPLMLAIDKNQPALALTLIKAGASPNAHDENYIYPLHKAAASGEMDLVKALVEAGADVNARTRDTEDTPLHGAIAQGRRGVAEYLVANGARIDIAGKDGKTAAVLAKETGPQMQKVVDPASVANDNARKQTEEFWELVSPATITKTTNMPSLSRRITEIFNFETQERKTMSQNLKTGAETVGPSEPFTALPLEALREARDKLRLAGGKAPDTAPASGIQDSPLMKFKI